MALLGNSASTASAAPETRPAFSYLTTFAFFELSGKDNAIAVGGNGEIFAEDIQTSAVKIYAPDDAEGGLPLTTVDVGADSIVTTSIAVDPATGDLYVEDAVNTFSVWRYKSNGQPVPTYTLDPTFRVSIGGEGSDPEKLNRTISETIAVDPTTHDLLITSGGAKTIRRYDYTGTLVETIPTPSVPAQWAAVAPDGSIYAAPKSGQTVTHLSATGAVIDTLSAANAGGLAVNQSNGRVTIQAGSQLKTFSSGGDVLSESPLARGSELPIAVDPLSGRVYVFAGSVTPGSGSIDTYVPAATPGVEAPTVVKIEPESAQVRTEVNPGPESGVAHFEFSADGGSSWQSTPEQPVVGPEPIEAELPGLKLHTGYIVRVKATNSLGTSVSSAVPFVTPEVAPVVETGPAGAITESSATLHGTVNPAGIQTTYRFEYGVNDSYGKRIPLEVNAPAGNRSAVSQVSKFVSGLQPGTTYHYRLVAQNAAGTSVGSDRMFSTSAPSEAFPQRAYEQVTPVDKGGAAVLSDGHVQSSADGSAIVVTSVAAPKGAESGMIFQNFLSRRGSDDWLNWQQVDPPQNTFPNLNESGVTAISADFEHALVVSNRVLAPGGIDGGGNLYVKDLQTGQYKFVGGAPGADAWNEMVGIQANERIFWAGAPDFSWVVFWVEPPLLPGAGKDSVYQWSESEGLRLESVFLGGFVLPFPLWHPIKPEALQVSSDGRVVVYSYDIPPDRTGPVLRRVGNQEPTLVSASHLPGSEGELQMGRAEGMTPDGRYVFFKSYAQLTEDAPPTGGLYRYDATTEGMTFIGPVARPPEALIGFSDDGQTVYYETGELHPGEHPGMVETRVWRDGHVHVITPTSVSATTEYAVTKNGDYLAWADPEGQAHVYDAVTNEDTCVSCPAAGEPSGKAHFMMGARIGNTTNRFLLEDGTMFFDTKTRLVTADHNGTKDVYEWKNGRLALISPGDEPFDAFFVAASADGKNVFFQTDQGLVPQDIDREADIYDARVGGGFASQSPPPPPGTCRGAECAASGEAPTGGPSVATSKSRAPRVVVPRGKVKVMGLTTGRGAVQVKVQVSQTGRLKVSGQLVRTTKRQLTATRSYMVRVPLKRAARLKQRAGKRLTLILKLDFSGGWGSSSAKYTKTIGK